MLPLNNRLKQPGVIVGDGALGTMLLQRGLKPGECPEHLNIENPGVLEEIAKLYLAAGAEIIETNTFGASPLKLAMYALDGKTEDINSLAVQAVRKIVGDRAYISASCGPTGKILEPYGDTKAELIYNAYVRQMKTLIAEGIDLICIETMSDLTEAILAVKAARSVSASVPVCVTMTFDATSKGFYTIMGVSVERAAKQLTEEGADIVGSNCGNGINNMIKIAAEFKGHTTLPVIIQSNAGLPTMINGVSVYPESPEFTAQKCKELINAGVKIIGGCCGTTPRHIAAIKKVADNFNRTARNL